MDAADFTTHVVPLKNKIFRLAKRLTGLDADAEDVTQDVFIRLWGKRSDLAGVNNIEAFAMTVTRNVCLDRLKTSKPVVELNGSEMQLADRGDGKAETADGYAIMARVVSALPEQQKTIVHLRDVEGYEYEQIAEITGINVNAIRVNLSRARKTIREELLKNYSYGLKTN